MIKNLTALFVVLLATGTGLTLYLPQYQPGSEGARQNIGYRLDQASLKTPLPMSATLLDPLEQENTGFGLRLGLFGQLSQAISQGQQYVLAQTPDIIKVTDEHRYWYLLILGPYPNEQQANRQSTALQEKHGVSATLIRWPLAGTKQTGSKSDGKKTPAAP